MCSLATTSRQIAGPTALTTRFFPVQNYDLAATLTSGQAFRWNSSAHGWVGVVGRHWVRLRQSSEGITAEAALPVADWDWLMRYLQLEVEMHDIVRTFPLDSPMQSAVRACCGLRLLRQEPWECLASFILSSTKQIVQIQQIVATLCARFGEPLAVPAGETPAFSFPSAGTLALIPEADLRGCKMGFRAKYLSASAQRIVAGEPDLQALATWPMEQAREALMLLPGVGRKIADCVLLFAYGFQTAFPVDVWVMRTLRRLYFPRRRVTLERLHRFAAEHFGPNAGYAQQYLFHYARVSSKAGARGSAPKQ